MKKINEQEFKELVESGKTIVIDFYADWCGPCRALGPIMEELETYFKDIVFCKVNVDEEENLALGFRVQSIPYVVMIKEGKMVANSLGLKSKDAMIELIEKNK